MERKFREAKQGYGPGRCRYLGRMRFAVQAFFTAIVLNLKHMVKLLTGVGFKTQAVAYARVYCRYRPKTWQIILNFD